MPIALSNVNISLQQFQDISRGKYNAGEVKLTSESSLGKVNDHVHFTFLNKTDISHAEVLAIKQAFVKALSEGGVGAEEIARIRRDLGLGAGKAVDTGLRDRSIKPLSRQQVREILDRNAAAINAKKGAGTIRTSDQLYAGVSEDARKSRAATRATVNAGLDQSRMVSEHRRISLFQALVAGDVDFRSGADRAELLKMANEALDIVLKQSNGHPREGVPARIGLGSGAVGTFSMDTGMDEAAWARKLEDMIIRLPNIAPTDGTIALREEFRAVPRQDRADYIDKLVLQGDDATPGKVRTLVILLLQDAGIADHESLSLVNHLSDAVATTFLRGLAALPEDASADDARALLAARRPLARAEAYSTTYVPATSTADFNDAVANALANQDNRLFGAFKTLAADLLADARAVFGAAAVPGDAQISSYLNITAVKDAIRAAGGGRIAPEALRAPLRELVFRKAANRVIQNHVAARAAELGETVKNPLGVANAVKSAAPDLTGRIAACANADEIAAVLAEVRDLVDSEIRRTPAIERCRAEFAGMIRDAISEKTGIPASALAGPALSSSRITGLAKRLVNKLARREIPAGTAEEIRNAFRAEAERFAASRAAILEKVAHLPLSAAVKAELADWLLAQDKVDYLDLDALLSEASKPDLSVLAAALRSGAPKETVYAEMKNFMDFVRPATSALLEGKLDEIGAPEKSNVATILMIAAFDRYPGIRTDLAKFFERPDVVADHGNRFSAEHDSAAYASTSFDTCGLHGADAAKAALAEKIAAGQPSPSYAQALVRAVRAEGIDLSPDDALAVFAQGTPLAATFAELLDAFEGEITPEALEGLARDAMHRYKADDILKMAETLRGLAPEG